MMTKNPYLPFIIANIIFGTNGVVASHIPLTSYEIVLCRTILGGLCLLALAAGRHEVGELLKHKKLAAWIMVAGGFLAGNWIFLYEAYTQIGVGLATIMCFSGPILLIILSRFIFGEPFTIPRVAGIILVTIGMFCINGSDVQANGFSWGITCGLLSAVCFAFLVIAMKKAQGLPGLIGSASQLLTAGVIVAVIVVFTHRGPVNLTPVDMAYIVLLCIVNTGLGYALYLSGVQRLSAQSVSICCYIEPLAALAFSTLFLGEVLTTLQWLGVILVLGGVAAAELWHYKG